jgi:hypothetical protein
MAPSYKNKITTRQAVDKAMAEAKKSLGKAIDNGKTLNCGEDDDYVWTDDESALNTAWSSKSFTHEDIEYSACKVIASSGEPKFDLRLAQGTNKAVFNYHVPFKKDTSEEEAIAKKSVDDKKKAAAHKLELEKQAKEKKEKEKVDAEAKKKEDASNKKRDLAMATDWNKLGKSQPKDKDKWEKAWLEKNKNRKF